MTIFVYDGTNMEKGYSKVDKLQRSISKKTKGKIKALQKARNKDKNKTRNAS